MLKCLITFQTTITVNKNINNVKEKTIIHNEKRHVTISIMVYDILFKYNSLTS